MKKLFLISIFLVLLLSIMLSGCASTTAQERTRGFDTPEACAQALVEALRAGDHNAFLACYAIPEIARSYNFEAFYEARGYYKINSGMFLPPTDSFSIAANESKLRQRVLDQLMLTNLFLDEDNFEWHRSASIYEAPTEQLSKFLQKRMAWSNLKLQKMLDPSLMLSDYSSIDHYYAEDHLIYGYKERKELVLVLDLDGQTLYTGGLFLRYDESWLMGPQPYELNKRLGMKDPFFLIIADEAIHQ